MDKNKSKRIYKSARVNIRITEKMMSFIRQHDFSPTAIFKNALEELGFKE